MKLPRKIHDNFQIDIQKISQIRKSWAPSFSNHKTNVGSFFFSIKHLLRRNNDNRSEYYKMIQKKRRQVSNYSSCVEIVPKL